MNKRILLLPNDLGGGRGHVSRMLYLAQILKASGSEAAIVLGSKYAKTAQKLNIPVFPMDYRWERLLKWQWKRPHIPYHKMTSRIQAPPVFVYFPGLDYQVPRDGYLSEQIVRFRLKQLQRICIRFKPDLIIGDTHLLARLLAGRCSLPIIQVTRKAGFPPKPDFLWWQRKIEPIPRPTGIEPFLKEALALGLDSIQTSEDLLRGDAYLIPSIRQIEPLPGTEALVTYTGPFVSFSERQPIPFFSGRNEYPNIYVTIGGGTNRGQLAAFFRQIVDVFKQTEFQVLVSTAGKLPAKQLNHTEHNIRFVDWVHGFSAIAESDFVIFHGGYSSTMETLLAGKPSLVIPGHTEQEGNGRRLEKLGVGKTILPYTDLLTPLDFKWTYGTYSMKAAYQLKLNRKQIINAVHELLYGTAVERVQRLRQNLIRKQKSFRAESIWSLIG